MSYSKVFKRPLFIVGAVVGVGLLIGPGLNAFILMISVLATYAILQNYLTSKVFDSRFFRAVLSIVIYTVFLQLVILVAWLFNHNFPLDTAVKYTGLFVALIYGCEKYWGIRRNQDNKDTAWIKLTDLYSVFVGLFILALIFAAPVINSLNNYGRIDPPSVSSHYVNTSLDDSSQLSRINDRLQLNRGVLYKTDRTDQVVHQNTISTYPPSWISANSAIIQALSPGIHVGGQSLIAYIISKSFWLFVLIYLFCRVVFSIYILFVRRDKKIFAGDYLWLCGALGFFSYYILLEHFKEGFYAFIPLLISQLLVLAFLLQLGSDNDKKNGFRSLLPLSLMFANAALAWILVLPAAVIALFAIIIPKRDSIKNLWKPVWTSLKAQIALVVFTIASILIQVHIITADSSRTFKEGVNDPGGITFHSRWYFAFVLIGVGLLFGFAVKQARLLRAIAPYLAGLFVTALFIYMFQVLTIDKPEYYFFKTLNTFLIVAVPLAVVGWLQLIRVLNRDNQPLVAACIAIGAVCCLPLIIGVDPVNTSNLGYLKGDRTMSLEDSSFIYSDMDKRSKIYFADRKSDTLFYVPGQVAHNIIASNIVRSIQKVDGCDAKLFLSILQEREADFFNDVRECQKNPLTIVTKPETFQQVKGLAEQYNVGPNVTIISVR